MKTIHIIPISILLLCLNFNLLWANTECDEAVSAAKAWLSLVDSGNYPESWKDASTYFQGAVAEKNWVNALLAARKPLGKLIRRNIIKAQKETALPGAPDGNYVVMSFETSFEHKKSAIETVTFMAGKEGKWRAVGYFIK